MRGVTVRSGSGNHAIFQTDKTTRDQYADPDGTEKVAEYRCVEGCPVAEIGEPARFFYVAKASRSERNAGLEGMPETSKKVAVIQSPGRESVGAQVDGKQLSAPAANSHPTVKPIALMRYLTRLICPPGGVVLDPFAGSGIPGVRPTWRALTSWGLNARRVRQDGDADSYPGANPKR